jgi:hypothetical protein
MREKRVSLTASPTQTTQTEQVYLFLFSASVKAAKEVDDKVMV